ncbi:MAG: RNA polymerase sporulation sigma factor SigK [Clostridiales bacterium]|nr:RNA polymerase sporulation sigma factor SigK [Clostridiales bacterium]
MKSFPKPLNAKEEQFYIERTIMGDREAREILIERNLRLVAHIVKKYNLGDRETDDLISVGTIGLIKAIDSFQPEKGIRLATYASRCIDNELLMRLRSGKKKAREIYLQDPIGSDKEGNEITLLDVIEYEDEDVVEAFTYSENVKMLYQMLNECLTKREREVLIWRYGLYGENEVTQREIAKYLGISRSYVSRIEKKAIAKLRDQFPATS